MASAKVLAKLQADQSSITQMAELHSKQGSSLSLNRKTVPQRWHQTVTTSQSTYKVSRHRNLTALLANLFHQSLRHLEMRKVNFGTSKKNNRDSRTNLATLLELLQRHQKDPPSLCLHLYPTYFKFEHEVRKFFIPLSQNKRINNFCRMDSFLTKVSSRSVYVEEKSRETSQLN